ncbi:MAG: hypothetical protein KF782_27340 [Labilithrix sp.]|nr:hypothetical protein [Labilithrix sp.]
MFEDLEEESADVTPDSPDRAIAWAIWSRGEGASITTEEAWAILHERYPDDPRFLLLNAYAELSESRRQADGPKAEAGVFTAAYFLKKVERVLGGATDALHPQLRDLVAFGGAVLVGAKGDDARSLAELRAKIGAEEGDPKRDERDRAGLRLRRFEREVVKELHERTEDGKPLGVRAAAPPAAAPANDWSAATADEDKPRRKYAATERFQRGELVEHPKFGVGVVTGTEPGKAVILFESGVRKLVAGG